MFKSIPALFLLLLIAATGQAQTVFRIDSLPVKSIILNKGWTWHPGDNPDWAKPGFDDSKWEPIDPSLDINRLPQLKKAGIGWFRLRLKVDPTLANTIVRLQINQLVASEVYLDERRIATYGKVSLNPDLIDAYNPTGAANATESVYVLLGPKTDQILAVRFALEPNLYYTHVVGINPCLQLKLRKVDSVEKKAVETAPANFIEIGIFLILLLLHLTFYFSFRSQIASLYFGYYCFLVAAYMLLDQLTLLHTHSVVIRMNVNLLLFFTYFFSVPALLTAIYHLFSYHNKKLYLILIIYATGAFFLDLAKVPGAVFLAWGYPIVLMLEVMRVSVAALRLKKPGAWIIVLGAAGNLLFTTAFLINNSISPNIIGTIFWHIGLLCVPISFTIYTAKEFARTSLSLQKNLNEVKQLSAEKEQILTTQNETLERQVTERTAELSHKNGELVVEAALERVRTQSMAMQYSDHLQDVITVVSEQLQALGFQFHYVNFVVYRVDRGWDCYSAYRLSKDISRFVIPYLDHRLFNHLVEVIQQGLGFFVYTLTPDEKREWLTNLYTNTILKDLPEETKQFVLNAPGYDVSLVVWPDIAFSIASYSGIPFTDTENAIFKRFGAVFRQAYTRFLDLKKAEEQAQEAIRTASLDRVRAEIASMRTTLDLERITPLIWTELTTLQVPFFRCGVFIVNEAQQRIQAFLSTPDGQSRTQLNLPIDQTPNTRQIVENWEHQRIYIDRWSHDQLQQWASSMVDEGQIDSLQEYEVVDEVKEAFSLQFVPFKQGMLYVGSMDPLTDSQMDLTQSLADAFSVAYARYEDFRQLEEAKARVDTTLTELKATQTQLIQKEKMASLGELTAGIAHEIQNPLNFVNNFSEVSTELVDELKDELAKGDTEEAGFIADDLRQNLQKINHHGGRASAIVRGMLEHSRMGTGDKRPTDLNALCDEYLKLAYQGIWRSGDPRSGDPRSGDPAKNQHFNCELITDFDTSLGPVAVVPQEIGRVLLNLYNNAFYAVGQRSKQAEAAYTPTVWVSTRHDSGQVELRVRDNGSGIAEAIKAKIFQPFFTTKPTGEGTGLGLSLSYDIVTKGHGGTLTVQTQAGDFTEFVITLPLS